MPVTPILGSLMAFGGNFAPRGYAACTGQILPISQYTALFSLLGTTYGGNGTSNFALPDLRGRTPIHMGQGPGLSPYVLGETLGVEAVTVLSTQLPLHSHALVASASSAISNAPSGNFVAEAHGAGRGGGFTVNLYAAGAPSTSLSPNQMQPAFGPGVPHNNIQPYLVITWCIALQGIYPSRN
jgi:microcystin-dependent protein